MKKAKIVKRSFSVNISLLVISVVAVLLITVFTVIFFIIRNIYIDSFKKQTVDVNSFVAAQIDGDKIDEFAKTFVKNDYYYELNSMLYRLKLIFNIKYLYIMADNGDPDNYTYIFDAVYNEETESYDDSHYGIKEAKSVFPGSEDVLKYGTAFKDAHFSDTKEYGRLFFAYAPITNAKGYTVAFLGTDISAEPMYKEINRVGILLTLFGLGSFIAIYFIITFYSKIYISKPLVKLSEDVARFSDGDLKIEIPNKLLSRKDELGLIYRSFGSVISTIRSLMDDLGKTADDIIKGSIGSYINYKDSQYKGSYKSIAESIDLLMDNSRKIFNLMPVYFYVYDDDFTVLYHNNPVKSGNSTLSNEIADYTGKAIKEDFFAFAESSDENRIGSFDIALPDKSVRHYNYFLIKNHPRSDVKNICCVLTDVTDYVEMSEKALASSKAKSEFLSKMSHEIRTPMNAIIGITTIAKRRTEIADVVKDLDGIQASSSHLLTVINDILDISKIESGKMEISKVIFDLNGILDDVAAIVSKISSDKGVLVKTEMLNPSGLPVIFYGDDVRIKQVVINLLSNAVKFSPKDSEVRFTVRIIDENNGKTKIYFEVKDQGIGIAPEKLGTIFDAFEQGGAEITRNFGGTGLGLSISNALVKLMGGEKIDVSSELGKGSVFSFILELENASSVNYNEKDDISIENIDFSGKRLLLVDDIEINRDIVSSLLEGSGIEIDDCDDGTSAVEKFSASPENYYDLIFMDIQMRIMDGYEASKIIRGLNRSDASKVVIIGLSANAFQSDIDAGSAAGMNDYIVKPVDYDIMVKKMKKYLSGGN